MSRGVQSVLLAGALRGPNERTVDSGTYACPDELTDTRTDSRSFKTANFRPDLCAHDCGTHGKTHRKADNGLCRADWAGS
mmetsp:Transcript_33214/g.86980  ORF Transcript_33214/g.86980 Transcript_33214/m.86980 type:complete len:80 (-) Transcript_33214:978-1217(-)